MHRYSLLIISLASATLLLPPLAQAETDLTLDPITVSVPRLVRDARETPAAVSSVAEEDIQQGRQNLQLDESLNRVPGLFFQNRYNFAQNLRLSVRGFGARAPFGVRGIRLRVDGIPETLPDGQSQVDGIDLESAERIEVIRGPSSALYGNAAGGVIDVTTRSGTEPPYGQARATLGSYGFRRHGVMGGGQQGNWNGHLSAWHMTYDGYREQSATEKMMLNTKGTYRFSPERELTTVLTLYNQPKGEDPGGLTREEVREDRRQANSFARQLDAGQVVEQQRLGLIYTDRELLPGTLEFTGFYTRRDFAQELPINPQFGVPSSLEFDRDFYGVGATYSDAMTFVDSPLRYTVGVEVSEQRDDRARFTVDDDGQRDEQTQDALETGTAAGIFGQMDLQLSERLGVTLGGRYDYLRLKVRDRREAGEASGREAYNEFSLSAGPSYQLHPDHQVYATIGTSFESPTFTELYDPTKPDTGFDPSVGPQRALNTEVGLKGFLGQRTRYDLAIFRVTTDDEIVPISDDPDRFQNAGETRRDGVELGVEHFFNNELSVSGAYTWSDFRFRDFEDEDGNNQRGNRLPGLPEHSLFAEMAWRSDSGAYTMVDTLLVGNVFADDENNDRVAGYGVVNFRVGGEFDVGNNAVEVFWALNNVLDKAYPANVRVNSGDNFLEPAPERNLHAGVRVTF